MELNTLGRVMAGIGLAFIVIGGLLILFSKLPLFRHLGHLPGDIRLEGAHWSCFMPITTMILISLLLSLALNILLRLFNRL